MTTPGRAAFKNRPVAQLLSLTLLWLILAGCAAANPLPTDTNISVLTPTTTSITSGSTVSVATATSRMGWLALLRRRPYPFTTPLPPSNRSPIDGLYSKEEPITGTPVPCRRCPDYLSEDGIWKLSLDQGVYHIFHPPTGWHSLGSFSIEGNRLYLFNDPTCHLEVGIYTWQRDKIGLTLTVVDDSCQVGRRANTFSDLSWRSCQPPNMEAAITGHWPQPPGCDSPAE